jgi:ABC-type transporter MlaC component
MQIESDGAGSQPVLVDYRVRKNEKFAIFDIIVEGVSMITTQRSEFTSVLANHDMNYLITQLANKAIASENEMK